MSEDDNKQGVTSLLSNVALLVTAGYGLKVCIEHPFISAGFGLFAARGLLGTIAYLDIKNENFEKVKEQLFKITDNFGFPLLAMDVMSCKCIKPEMNLLQLLGPAMDLIGFEMDKDTAEVLKASHAMTAGSVIVCAQQKPEFWGSILFPVPFISDRMIEELGEIKDYHEFLLLLGNILAVGIMTEKIP